MDKCIDSLGEAKTISTFDCSSGHRQAEMDKGNVNKKVIVAHNGLEKYKRVCEKTSLIKAQVIGFQF